jgi:oligopeptidase B
MKNMTYGFRLIIFLPLVGLLFGCNHSRPPVAEQIASEKVIQGVRITDPYKWMENLNDPNTIAYINAENTYTDHYFNHLSGLKNNLLKELEERDTYENKKGTIPILIGNYFYYTRTNSGKDFPNHYRKLNNENAKEEPLLDETQLAEGSLNYRMNQFLASPDNSCYFYCYTLNGDKCRLMIQSFGSKVFADSIIAPVTSAIWAPDCKSIVYVKDCKEVFIHKINTSATQDVLTYIEKREDLKVDVDVSGSGKYIFINSYNKESTECSFIPSDLKNTKPKLIDPLKVGRRYFTDHFGSNFFLILSDEDYGNRRLYKALISSPSVRNWATVLEGNDSLYIDDFTLIDQKYLLLFETKKLNARMRLIDLSFGGKDNQITFREPDGHIEFLYFDRQEGKIVFFFASMLTPITLYNYDIDSHQLTIRMQSAIKDYHKENYIAELVWAKSGDGTLVPISMIHKNGMKRSDGRNPLYLEGYGSYGCTVQKDFNSARISLLDRGFYLAMAHVRGGGELGKKWWEAGKLMNKKNAVADYLACAEYLIKQGYTAKGMITAAGSNAGGLVIGAAVNQHPDLFKAVLLMMPFVDPLSSLLDSASYKDNPDEWPEFGNPNIPEQFEYIYGYSPYDNIKKQDYPAMLFRTSFKDQKAEFSGPLKMVAKLRATATGKNILLIRIDDRKTHMGDTGKKKDNDFMAENWAFILDQYEIEK